MPLADLDVVDIAYLLNRSRKRDNKIFRKNEKRKGRKKTKEKNTDDYFLLKTYNSFDSVLGAAPSYISRES